MLEAAAVAFGLVLLAELGDKSQLLALAFATRYPPLLVLLAVTIGALIMEGAAVLLGTVFALALPTAALQVGAGVIFLAFAAWTLREADDDEHAAGAPAAQPRRWLLAGLVGAFAVAELADKTQLVTLTLASTNDPLGTWLGASAGVVAVSALAIAVGAALGTRLPQRAIRLLSAAAFAIFGVLLIAGGLGVM